MLPDEKSKRFIAILNKKIPVPKLLNALGHMTAGLCGGFGRADEMCFLEYRDKDGGVHSHVSHFGFIVLEADNSSHVRKVRTAVLARGVMFTDFTSTMTVGTSAEQQANTAATPEVELEYYGICLFGRDRRVAPSLRRNFRCGGNICV